MKNSVANIPRRHVHLVGTGIAALASAAYFVRDGHLPGSQITNCDELYIGLEIGQFR